LQLKGKVKLINYRQHFSPHFSSLETGEKLETAISLMGMNLTSSGLGVWIRSLFGRQLGSAFRRWIDCLEYIHIRTVDVFMGQEVGFAKIRILICPDTSKPY
jgi:hypothetical protein